MDGGCGDVDCDGNFLGERTRYFGFHRPSLDSFKHGPKGGNGV